MAEKLNITETLSNYIVSDQCGAVAAGGCRAREDSPPRYSRRDDFRFDVETGDSCD